jgi:hypothetical protein
LSSAVTLQLRKSTVEKSLNHDSGVWRLHASEERAQGQVCPHTLETSLTQALSQLVLQQNGSTPQICVTQGSQPEARLEPVTHLS